MRKLLSANFSRLWKSKIFWVLEAVCFVFGVFVYTLVAINTRNLGQGWLEYNAHAYFYLPILFIAVVIAIFSCFFIGTDYSDGTIRNKLIVGHSRKGNYLSYLMVTAAVAMLFVAGYLLAVFAVGLPFSGSAVITHVELQPWRMMNFVLVIMEYTALFVLLSMLDSNKARNVVISLLVAVSVIMIGMMLYGRYAQPEFVNHVVVLPDGGIELKQGTANSKYLSGTIRTVVEWSTLLLPSGSVMLSLDRNLDFDWRNPLVSVILIIVLTGIGIQLLKKKDIK